MASHPTEKVAATSGDQVEIERATPNLDSTGLHNASLDDKALNISALAGTEAEHSYGVISGFKTYKRAAFWSIRKSPRCAVCL